MSKVIEDGTAIAPHAAPASRLTLRGFAVRVRRVQRESVIPWQPARSVGDLAGSSRPPVAAARRRAPPSSLWVTNTRIQSAGTRIQTARSGDRRPLDDGAVGGRVLLDDLALVEVTVLHHLL